MLYLSLYFKTHRQRYYSLLDEVRRTGDWEVWLTFFAEAVTMTAGQAVETAQRLLKQAVEDRIRIGQLGRMAGSALQVHRVLQERPIATPLWITGQTALTPPTVNACLRQLAALDIVTEITGQKRNRLYNYQAYTRIMNEGTLVRGLPPR